MTSKRPPQSKPTRDTKILESAEVRGHTIVVRAIRRDKKELLQLFIDGRKVPFVETEDGYIVGYSQAKSLLKAAKLYAEARFDTADEKGGKR